MKILDAGVIGAMGGKSAGKQVRLREPWSRIVPVLAGSESLKPVQAQALGPADVLNSRQHLVVAAPTNSGKSLIAHVVLLEAVLAKRRAVLLEPLRALAQEQADLLEERLARLVPHVLPQRPTIRVATGDYRLEGELPADLAPGAGEIVVATPERFEAILRNPRNAAWTASIGACVVDEAHLVGDWRRGPTLELAVASMLSLQVPPRVALLSATMGKPERLREWLRPCTLIESTARTPLHKEVWKCETGDACDEVLVTRILDILRTAEHAVMLFVYRRDTVEKLSRQLADAGVPALGYHAGLTAAARAGIRADFTTGRARCLVSTTSLAMGVNLPATHVIVRDTTFFGTGRLSVRELLQILGRAGRGDTSGHGAVVVRPSDAWDAQELVEALRTEHMPPLQSAFEVPRRRSFVSRADDVGDVAAANVVATCLARAGEPGASLGDIERLLGNTLGATAVVGRVSAAIRWLSDPARGLTYRDEAGTYHLTALGQAGTRSMLPLEHLAGLGQLIRDLLSLSPSGSLLERWTTVDHLLVIGLMSDRTPGLRKFSEPLVERIEAWTETQPMPSKSVLFAEWVRGSAATSKADELFGSLGVPIGAGREQARRQAFSAMLAAIVLVERSRGTSVEDLERRWDLKGLSGVEESWRDTALWLVAGHAAVCDIRCFYHHLKEQCDAGREVVRAAKNALRGMRSQAYLLLHDLKYCSPLGSVLRSVRRVVPSAAGTTVGVATARALEGAGVTSLQELAELDVQDLVDLGVRPRFAKQLRAYVNKRLR